jgi:AcrR family transcriptional regulator
MTTVTKEDKSRRARKKADVRARIVAAGIDLFSRHGIAEVTVDQIAEAADIGKGTIYNYFQTKEDIVVAFMVDIERRVQARLSRFTAPEASLDAILTAFIRFQFRLKARHHEFVRAFLGQMIIDPPLESLFRNLQHRGAIRTDISLPELILVFKTIHLGLTALWAIEGPPFRASERTLKQEMTLFCEGLKNDH